MIKTIKDFLDKVEATNKHTVVTMTEEKSGDWFIITPYLAKSQYTPYFPKILKFEIVKCNNFTIDEEGAIGYDFIVREV